MTENDFFDLFDDVLERNPNPDDFYNVLNLYQGDPLDDLEDFLEMNEIFDDLFETVVSNFLNTCNTVC